MSSSEKQTGASSSGHSPNITRIARHSSLSELDELCINTIRCLSMDAVQKAKSGHPGMPMGMAAAGYLLWTRFLRHNPANPRWTNRDRFVLSAGHGCMLLYSLLHLTGYDMSLDEIRNFRQWGSKTPGHPEFGHTPGVEVTTGPLGQGISNGVGMAIAEKYLAAYFNREGFPLINYRIFAFAGDGCLQEGVSSEASSLAGHLGLNNLIVVYDDNHITIDGGTDLAFTENSAKRYESYGWFVQTVGGDGNDLKSLESAINSALDEPDRPSLIRLRTHIGFGSPNKQDSAEAHGSPLGEEEVALTKVRYGWDPQKKFEVPYQALSHFRQQVEKGAKAEHLWNAMFERYASVYPGAADEFRRAEARMPPAGWEDIWRGPALAFDSAKPVATREAQGRVLDAVMPKLPLVLGGSADLTPSNNTRFRGVSDFTKADRLGRYIRYGVREHAMGAIMNGIAVSDLLIPYGATFFAFSDYMRPAIRLAALSQYPTIFVFTHDSIGLGEDGPTHQAVEQTASFRCMPGLVILRPADANETVVAWRLALERRDGPTMLLLTRQKVPVLDQKTYAPASNVRRGAYTLISAEEPRVLLIASGSEVHLALTAYAELAAEGIPGRVVSMPSWELFEQQTPEYRASVLPPDITSRVAVEAGVRNGWERYIGDRGTFVGMHSFGASAPVEVVFKGFGITVESVVRAAKESLS
jgi:transketolase